MKRSDMIAIISDELCSFFPKMELKQRNLIADYMLVTVEKNGMIPPAVRSLKTIGGYEHEYQYWESEDETI